MFLLSPERCAPLLVRAKVVFEECSCWPFGGVLSLPLVTRVKFGPTSVEYRYLGSVVDPWKSLTTKRRAVVGGFWELFRTSSGHSSTCDGKLCFPPLSASLLRGAAGVQPTQLPLCPSLWDRGALNHTLRKPAKHSPPNPSAACLSCVPPQCTLSEFEFMDFKLFLFQGAFRIFQEIINSGIRRRLIPTKIINI